MKRDTAGEQRDLNAVGRMRRSRYPPHAAYGGRTPLGQVLHQNTLPNEFGRFGQSTICKRGARPTVAQAGRNSGIS